MHSNLEYGFSVWTPYKQDITNDLEKVQKRATKMVSGCKHLKYKNRLKYLKYKNRLKYLKSAYIEI